MLEVSLLGVGTVLRLERNAWSKVKRLRQATNEYAPPPSFLWGCAMWYTNKIKFAESPTCALPRPSGSHLHHIDRTTLCYYATALNKAQCERGHYLGLWRLLRAAKELEGV